MPVSLGHSRNMADPTLTIPHKDIFTQNTDNYTASNSKKKLLPQNTPCISDGCVQILAWLLLTTGLCIIISTFYLAIRQANAKGTYDGYNDPTEAAIITKNITDTESGGIDVLEEFDECMKRGEKDRNLEGIQGCQEVDCKIGCVRTRNIYEELEVTVKNANCQYIDILLVEDQKFPHGVLKNYWRDENSFVRELFIRWSNVTRIKTDAFNSKIFLKTFFLLLADLKLRRVDSGALLGLHSLKYLVIDTSLPDIDRAFFQPVQTTLKFLKLNSDLEMDKRKSVFGIAHMVNLEYLDLSNNNLKGPITKKMFYSTPNLRYFVMTNSKVTSIESGAFDNLAQTLQLINLSANFITTLSGDVFTNLLKATHVTFINLSMNNWHCDCLLRPFVQTYNNYHRQFMDILYCRAPHSVYGKSITDVNYNYCTESTTESTTEISHESSVQSIRKDDDSDDSIQTETTNSNLDNNDNSSDEETEGSKVFEMRCLNAVEDTEDTVPIPDPDEQIVEDDESSQSSSESADSSEELKTSRKPILKSIHKIIHNSLQTVVSTSERSTIDIRTDSIHYFEFEPPEFDFTLELLADRTAKVIIENAKVNMDVIWFCENNLDTSDNIIYNCMAYNEPYLITDTLQQNVTYTFCIMRYYEVTISPFNCLPLYVPVPKASEDVLIPLEEKQFTIGMLCLIFALSAFVGAVIAYFGIRRYPDLLEGSKNVLVVKKSDQNDYVSTMSETDYLKNASFKKNSLHSSTKSSSSKSPLTESVSSSMSPPFCISSKSLERLSSVKSNSTLFEESFGSFAFPGDEYEMPKSMELEFQRNTCSSNHAYATSPSTPPPLPKRNSNATDSLNLVLNHISDGF